MQYGNGEDELYRGNVAVVIWCFSMLRIITKRICYERGRDPWSQRNFRSQKAVL